MFESVMWKYMKEEKDLLLKTFNTKLEILDMEALYIVAHGSSYNAASAIAPFLSKWAKIRVYVYTLSAFINNCISIQYEKKETTCVMGISQTGTSRGVLEAIESIRPEGFKILSITNEKDSPIEKISDCTYYLQVNEEESNAKTKGYSATLVVLLAMSIQMAFEKKQISIDTLNELMDEIKNQIQDIPDCIENTIQWCLKNNYGKNMNNIYVIGNGMNFATAMEGQLKLMETQCIPTMFSDIIEFSHGMHRSLNEESFVLLINDGTNEDLMNKTFDYCKTKKYNICMIDTKNHTDDQIINVKDYKHTHSILLITSVIQAISAFVPENNGTDPNRDANNDYTDWMETRVL